MMDPRDLDISLILPAYNEVKTICTTLEQATAYFRARSLTYEIIVAADGDDGTREKVREFAKGNKMVRAIGSPGRHGKGKGIRDAMRLASGRIVGFADADNKVPIDEFDKLEPHFRSGFEVVIGSRALGRSVVEKKQPWYRRAGSRGFYYVMNAIVGIPGIKDTQCGFKFFQREVALDLFSRQQIDGYMFDIEILALAQRLNYQIKEEPIRWHDDADSRLQLVSGNIRNVRDLLRIRQLCRVAVRAPATVQAKVASGE